MLDGALCRKRAHWRPVLLSSVWEQWSDSPVCCRHKKILHFKTHTLCKNNTCSLLIIQPGNPGFNWTLMTSRGQFLKQWMSHSSNIHILMLYHSGKLMGDRDRALSPYTCVINPSDPAPAGPLRVWEWQEAGSCDCPNWSHDQKTSDRKLRTGAFC